MRLREDLADEGVSNAALLALSPLIVLAVEEGPSFLPLLLPPLAVVHKGWVRSRWTASARP